MLRILSLVFALLIVIGGIILVVGYTAVPSYKEAIMFDVEYSQETVWKELLNIQQIPNRKTDVESVEVLEEYGKFIAWQENLKNGGLRIYRMNEREENELLVLELTSSSYGLTGVWTFELNPVLSSNTQIIIQEESKLTHLMRRGYRTIMGREHDLLVWQKYIKVGLVESLLKTP